jgi:hypothetical protein
MANAGRNLAASRSGKKKHRNNPGQAGRRTGRRVICESRTRKEHKEEAPRLIRLPWSQYASAGVSSEACLGLDPGDIGSREEGASKQS